MNEHFRNRAAPLDHQAIARFLTAPQAKYRRGACVGFQRAFVFRNLYVPFAILRKLSFLDKAMNTWL